MRLKKQVARGLIWTTLQGAGTQLISFAVFLILARLLDPESFGLVAMATVAVAFFKIFGNFGFGSAIVQRKDLEPGHLNTAFWVDTAVGLAMLAVTVLSANWVARLYGEERLTPIIQVLALLFLPTALCQVQISILRRNLDFQTLAIRTLVAELVGGIIGIGCAIADYGAWSLVARQLVSAFTGAIILWVLSNWRPGLDVSTRYFIDLFGFSVKMMGANIVTFLSNRSDLFFIGYFLGPVMLGYYTVALRLISILVEFLGGTINRVAWPAFAKLQDQPERIRSGFYLASQLLAFVVMPVFMGIYSVAPELVPVVFGEQWEQSIPVLRILVFLGIILAMNQMYDSILVSVGRPGLWLIIRAAISICNVVAFFFALRAGLNGVALAYVAVAYTFLPVYLYMLNSVAGISTKRYLATIIAPVIASILMTVALINIANSLQAVDSATLRLVELVAAGIAIYGLVITIISPQILNNLLDVLKSMGTKKKRG